MCSDAMVLGSCKGYFLGVGIGIVKGDVSQKLFFVCREILKNELCSVCMSVPCQKVTPVVGQLLGADIQCSSPMNLYLC